MLEKLEKYIETMGFAKIEAHRISSNELIYNVQIYSKERRRTSSGNTIEEAVNRMLEYIEEGL